MNYYPLPTKRRCLIPPYEYRMLLRRYATDMDLPFFTVKEIIAVTKKYESEVKFWN